MEKKPKNYWLDEWFETSHIRLFEHSEYLAQV